VLADTENDDWLAGADEFDWNSGICAGVCEGAQIKAKLGTFRTAGWCEVVGTFFTGTDFHPSYCQFTKVPYRDRKAAPFGQTRAKPNLTVYQRSYLPLQVGIRSGYESSIIDAIEQQQQSAYRGISVGVYPHDLRGADQFHRARIDMESSALPLRLSNPWSETRYVFETLHCTSRHVTNTIYYERNSMDRRCELSMSWVHFHSNMIQLSPVWRGHP
jgi:hypothetical protein